MDDPTTPAMKPYTPTTGNVQALRHAATKQRECSKTASRADAMAQRLGRLVKVLAPIVVLAAVLATKNWLPNETLIGALLLTLVVGLTPLEKPVRWRRRAIMLLPLAMLIAACSFHLIPWHAWHPAVSASALAALVGLLRGGVARYGRVHQLCRVASEQIKSLLFTFRASLLTREEFIGKVGAAIPTCALDKLTEKESDLEKNLKTSPLTPSSYVEERLTDVDKGQLSYLRKKQEELATTTSRIWWLNGFLGALETVLPLANLGWLVGVASAARQSPEDELRLSLTLQTLNVLEPLAISVDEGSDLKALVETAEKAVLANAGAWFKSDSAATTNAQPATTEK